VDGETTRALRPVTSPLNIDARTLLLFAAWAFFTVSGGFQWFGSSADNENYYFYYVNLNTSPDWGASRFEIGFQLWAWVAKFILRLGFEPFVMTLIGVSLGIKFYLFRRHTSIPIIAAIAYLLGFFFLHEYTQFRAAMGISLSLLGLHKQLEGKALPALAWYFLGALFHYSVVLIPIIALLSRFVRRKDALVLIAVASAAVAVLLPLIREQLVDFLSVLNPLSSVYFYGAEGSANIFSLFNIAMGLASLYAVAIGYLARSAYHRTFLVLGISSLAALLIMQSQLILALRLKEMLSIAFIFAFTRSRPEMRDLPLLFLLLIATGYAFWLGIGELYLF